MHYSNSKMRTKDYSSDNSSLIKSYKCWWIS